MRRSSPCSSSPCTRRNGRRSALETACVPRGEAPRPQSLHIWGAPTCHNGGRTAHIHPQPHKAHMAITMNKIKRSSGASDPGKTSDLSAARDAAAAKPTRRSARGSEVVAREKKERREARGQGKKATARVSSTANRRGGGAAGRDGARGAGGGAKGAGGRTQRAAMRYATDNRFVSWVYDFTTTPTAATTCRACRRPPSATTAP